MSEHRRGKILSIGAKVGNLVSEPDHQSDGLAALDNASPEFLQAFDAHFANFTLANREQKKQAAVRLRNRIANGRKNANKAFISIGNAILQTEEEGVFTPAEFEHLLSGGQQIMLMSKQQASMLRRVAKAIRDHIIPQDRVPEGYSVAYQCLLLRDQNPSGFQRALETGVIRPETSRREIMALREAESTSPPITVSQNREELLTRKNQLQRKETTLSNQLRYVREELRDVVEALEKPD